MVARFASAQQHQQWVSQVSVADVAAPVPVVRRSALAQHGKPHRHNACRRAHNLNSRDVHLFRQPLSSLLQPWQVTSTCPSRNSSRI